MAGLVSLVTPLHKKTKRDYLGRMMDEKVHCMNVARDYAQSFWDGDRRYGYGGYRYDGRWKAIAETLIQRYRLKGSARLLDLGCGKAHLLFELKKLLPDASIVGMDISSYALENAKPEIKNSLVLHSVSEPYPYEDNYFDLVISLTTLHNLQLPQLFFALTEMQRVASGGYFVVESYRNTQELFNLQCWALTCESFFSPSEWEWIMKRSEYMGDYEFIFFE